MEESMKKKKYSKSERMYFVRAFNESGLSLNEFSIRNKLNYYALKVWLKNSNLKSNHDAGVVIVRGSTSFTDNKSIKIENSNGMVCFSSQDSKPKSVLIKNNNNQIQSAYLTERINFRNTIDECCIKLLDLSYTRSNLELIYNLLEVLN